MNYPERIVKSGEPDADIVKVLKEQLNNVLALDKLEGSILDPSNPDFGPKTKLAVKLFQARNVDGDGKPLKQDGEVGPLTWAALFGPASVPDSSAAPGKLLKAFLEAASREVAKGVRERPRNSNRGPEVEEYLKSTGTPPGNPWCCAFVYWCFDEAANSLGLDNPMVRTAGCLDHWNRAGRKGIRRIPVKEARENPSALRPGMIFILDFGGGLGHTGIVESIEGGLVKTIEGNTDASKTREGGGVYRLTRRVSDINKGFIDYSSL